MTYNEFISAIDEARADNATFYGDFGFDFQVEWNNNTVNNIQVTWPALTQSYVEDAYRFAEALSSFCFELNTLVGVEVDD